MTRRQYSNLAPAVLTTGSLSAGATAVTVTSLSGFPATFPYTVALERGTASEELVLVTGAVGASATMTRGYGGTTAKSHETGIAFEHVIDATDADEANLHVNATSGVHGVVGSVVGTSDTQTLSNKTLSSSRGLATTTDPGLKLQATGSGTADQLQCLDTAGTSTVAAISRTGAFSALSAALTGAVTAASATLTGLLTAGSASISGTVTAASANISGALSAASGAFSGNVTANNLPAVAAAKAGKKIHWGTAAVTTDSSGNATITHGAGFTPTVVMVTARSNGGHAGMIGAFTIGATTFDCRVNVASPLSLTIMFTCFE